MSDMKDFLRDVGYFGVGAAAVIVETGAKAVKALVRKGEKTLRDNQDTVDEIKRKAKEAGERIKDAVEKVSTPPEEPAVEEPTVEEPVVEEPVAPDVIYHTDEPVPEEPIPEEPTCPAEPEKPEETING